MVTTTNYIYDGFQLLGETDETGTVTRRYINEPDDYTHPIGHVDVDTGDSFLYHYDGQGNTRAVTDENENVTDTFTFDSWGNLLSRTGMTNVPFQFGGEHGYYKDEELDTYYVMERVYDPSIIRWLSVDPVGFADGENLYAYVLNNPVEGFDPSGTISLRDAARDYCGKHLPKPWGRYGMRNCISNLLKNEKEITFEHWYQLELSELSKWHNTPGWPACPCELEIITGKRFCGSGPQRVEYVIVEIMRTPDEYLDEFTQPSQLWDKKYHPGAEWEIRSRRSLNSSGAGEQCTYDESGKLITNTLGAGSADRQAPALGWWTPLGRYHPPHLRQDVDPWDLAFELDGMTVGDPEPGDHLLKYAEVRPTNNKNGCEENPPL